MNRKKILWGITGSVAASIYEICKYEEEFDFQFVVTEHARHFLKNERQVEGIKNTPVIYFDSDMWRTPRGTLDPHYRKGDPVLHLDLADWCDVMVIAPLTVNTLGKMVNGICDNLLLSTYFSLPQTKHIIISPIMNLNMWKNAAIQKNMDQLRRWHCLQHAHDFSIISSEKGKFIDGSAVVPFDEIIKKLRH